MNRVGAFAAAAMIVATGLHILVAEPVLIPLQRIGPSTVLAMLVCTLIRSTGV